MDSTQSCVRRGCPRAVVTTFCREALCLDHFCDRSYEFLSLMDERIRSNAGSLSPHGEQIQIADECARRVLDICMSRMLLNNLERARLLDILLWCGNLVGSPMPGQVRSYFDSTERGAKPNPLPSTINTAG